MKSRIKKVLNVEDGEQDDVLDIFIENISNHLKAMLGKDVPSHLEFIVEEIVIRRFNRIGTEGMQSESVEGHTVRFYDLKDEFVPYKSIIDEESEKGKGGKGKVIWV